MDRGSKDVRGGMEGRLEGEGGRKREWNATLASLFFSLSFFLFSFFLSFFPFLPPQEDVHQPYFLKGKVGPSG